MDQFHETIYLDEIIRQCRQAMLSIQRLDGLLKSSNWNSEEIFAGLDDFLDHSARISLIFWPERRGDQDRGKHLRDLFNISDDDVLRQRDMRNNLAHFDERLDRFVKSANNRMYSDINIGPRDMIVMDNQPAQYMRHFVPRELVYIFQGEEYETRPLALRVNEVLNQAVSLKAANEAAR